MFHTETGGFGSRHPFPLENQTRVETFVKACNIILLSPERTKYVYLLRSWKSEVLRGPEPFGPIWDAVGFPELEGKWYLACKSREM